MMNELLSSLSIQVNEKIYLKNPESSKLGTRIIAGSIDLIDSIGFDSFTFSRLGKEIGSTEASIYRYFENKHKLLLYLTCWYWGWMEYRLVFGLTNIGSPHERLAIAIALLTGPVEEDTVFTHVDQVKLHSIVISESSKAYMTREVDEENRAGIFAGYKTLVSRVRDIILEINPHYKYPKMLISTVIEGAHHERYFARHLPRLTDTVKGEDSITEFYKQMVNKAIA